MLEHVSYVPTLAIRTSEMSALELLPGETKDRMTPCILLAPWATATTLEKAIARVQRAFPKRDYFLDIDLDYARMDGESDASAQLEELKDSSNYFQNWQNFCAQFPHVIPCLRLTQQSVAEIRRQIDAFRHMGRQFALRITPGIRHAGAEVENAVRALRDVGAADFAIILDAGWVPDALSIAPWFSGMIGLGGLLAEIDVGVPIVVSCTTIPKEFAHFEGLQAQSFNNRAMFDQLRRSNNRPVKLVYGDWGSTRPRELSGFRSRPLDRIDYPTKDAWIFARSKILGWDYQDAAKQIIKSSGRWDGDLAVWGEEQIAQTAVNPALGINNPGKAVAVRVNIHLHRQAFFDIDDIGGRTFEEPWSDDDF